MIYLSQKVYKKIFETVGINTIETGGILAESKGIIDTFIFDKGIKSSKSTYIPNVNNLNLEISKWHQTNNRRFVGMIHSHTFSKKLSGSDLEYASKLINAFELDLVYMFLVVFDIKDLLGFKCYFNKEHKLIVEKQNIKII